MVDTHFIEDIVSEKKGLAVSNMKSIDFTLYD